MYVFGVCVCVCLSFWSVLVVTVETRQDGGVNTLLSALVPALGRFLIGTVLCSWQEERLCAARGGRTKLPCGGAKLSLRHHGAASYTQIYTHIQASTHTYTYIHLGKHKAWCYVVCGIFLKTVAK